MVCLDSGCGDYERLWLTTSLRGMVGGTLRVDVLEEGVHSGDASGVVPSSFRILRQLLARIEDIDTGEITGAGVQCADSRPSGVKQAKVAAQALGDAGLCQVSVRRRHEAGRHATWPSWCSIAPGGRRFR